MNLRGEAAADKDRIRGPWPAVARRNGEVADPVGGAHRDIGPEHEFSLRRRTLRGTCLTNDRRSWASAPPQVRPHRRGCRRHTSGVLSHSGVHLARGSVSPRPPFSAEGRHPTVSLPRRLGVRSSGMPLPRRPIMATLWAASRSRGVTQRLGRALAWKVLRHASRLDDDRYLRRIAPRSSSSTPAEALIQELRHAPELVAAVTSSDAECWRARTDLMPADMSAGEIIADLYLRGPARIQPSCSMPASDSVGPGWSSRRAASPDPIRFSSCLRWRTTIPDGRIRSTCRATVTRSRQTPASKHRSPKEGCRGAYGQGSSFLRCCGIAGHFGWVTP